MLWIPTWKGRKKEKIRQVDSDTESEYGWPKTTLQIVIFRKFYFTSTDQYCDLTAYVPGICQHFFLVLNLRRKTRREISVAACGRRPSPLKTQSICAGIIQCNTERRKRQLHTNEREIRITMRGKALKEKKSMFQYIGSGKDYSRSNSFFNGYFRGC